MTEGDSGWTPLIAGLMGAIGGPIVLVGVTYLWRSAATNLGGLFSDKPLSLNLPRPETSLQSVKKKPIPPEVKSPTVTPRGGEDFSLEVRASFTAQYYGYGWLSGPRVSRDKKFDLYWEQRITPHISRSAIATIRIANWGVDFPYNRTLTVWGDGEIVHSEKTINKEWFNLRVELHARGIDESWEHRYRFRVKDRQFEIEEVQEK